MKIEYLGDHPDTIPILAGWIYAEWSFMYPGKTKKYIESLLRKRLNKKRLPITLVAFEAGEPVGTISLKSFDMETKRNLSPWIASLYVERPWRKKGIGSRLIKALEAKAAELNFRKLYLFTVKGLVSFYVRLGWKIKEQTLYHSYSVTIMEKDL
jgi:predicted N-acetyltransferase YhbS